MSTLLKHKDCRRNFRMECIKNCQKCGLCCNQKPMLDCMDCMKECQVFWVGLSAKMAMSEYEIPLSPETNTGKVIQSIEETLEEVNTYRTNLVKCVPLNEQRKLRYPSKKEMDCCFENLQKEISMLSPKIVFLLGEKVTSSVEKHLGIKFEEWDEFNYQSREHKGTYYVPVHHPSYIYVYKRKMIEQYAQGIRKVVMSLL